MSNYKTLKTYWGCGSKIFTENYCGNISDKMLINLENKYGGMITNIIRNKSSKSEKKLSPCASRWGSYESKKS